MDTSNRNCDGGLQLMPDINTSDENNSLCLISSEGNTISGNDVVYQGCHAINDHLNRSGKGKRILPSSFQLHANTSSRNIKISYGKSFSSKSHALTEVNRSIDSKADQDDDNSRSLNAQRIMPQSLVASEKNTDTAGNDSTVGEKAVIVYNERAIYEETLKNLSEPKFFANISEELLSVSLLFHQKVALAWMIQKERSTHCTGGILADDQGLGKTISTIALILKQRALQSKFKANNIKPTRRETLNLDDDEEDGNITTVPTSSKWKPAAGTLIVCPGTVLRQWARELDEKVNKKSRLSVLIYHGGKRTRDPRHLTKYDVVLTTYSIVTNEVVKFPLDFDGDGEQTNMDENRLRGSPFKKRKFCNPKKNRTKNANMVTDSYFDSDNGPLGRVRWFRVILDEAQTIKNHQTKVAKACSGLRSRSRWCLSGTPVQNSIDDLYSYFRFLRYEPYAAYSSFCKLIRGPISQNASYGCKKLQAVLNTVLLRRTKGTLIDQEPIAKLPPKKVYLKKVDFSPEEHLLYKKLEEEARQLVNQYAAAGTTEKNYTSILLMILRLRQACSHPLLVKDYNTDTIVKGSLEMANQLPKDKLSKLLNQLEESQAICHVCNDPPENAVVTICGHVFCYQCVSESLTGDENICSVPGCKEKLSTELVFSRSTLQKCTSNQDDANHSSSKSLLNNADGSLFQSSYVSSKIKAALEILNNLSTPHSVEDSNEWNESNSTVPVKAIVFSQWNGMLNLFEKALNRSHILYRRLDGSMPLAQRDKSVMEFNSNPKVTVMLMALKAGNLGLNMVAASHVILLDLWWNPSTEDQAIDRAHRIGQTRTVSVTRITIKDTVEDRILALQEEKRRLVASALGEDKISARARRRLTMKDLKYLFKI